MKLTLEELLKYNLENAKDLACLKDYKFSANEALSLIEAITSPARADIDGEKKQAYLALLRSCTSSSAVTSAKYLKHLQEAIEGKNFDRLFNSWIFVWRNVAQKAEMDSFVDELKTDKAHTFLSIIATGYAAEHGDVDARKREIMYEVVKFLWDKGIFPHQKQAMEIILGARNLKEGGSVMQFFIDSALVNQGALFANGFPHNFLIEFFSEKLDRESGLALKKREGMVELMGNTKLPISHREKIDEEKLKKFLLNPHCDLNFLSFLFEDKPAAQDLKDLLKKLVLSTEDKELSYYYNILDFLNHQKFNFSNEELRDFLGEIKLVKRDGLDIYSLAICLMLDAKLTKGSEDQLRKIAKEECDFFVPEFDLQNLISLEKLLSKEELFSKLAPRSPLQPARGDKARQFFAWKLLTTNVAVMEFLFNAKDGENFKLNDQDLKLFMLGAAEGEALESKASISQAELKSFVEKSIAAGFVKALHAFFTLTRFDFDDKAKQKFLDDVVRKMVEVNFNNPGNEKGKPFFGCDDFKLFLWRDLQLPRDSETAADLNLTLLAIASIASSLSKGDEVLKDKVLAYNDFSRRALEKYYQGKFTITKDHLSKVFNHIIMEKAEAHDVVFEMLRQLVSVNDNLTLDAIKITPDAIKKLYLESFVGLVASGKSQSSAKVANHLKSMMRGCLTVEEVFQTAIDAGKQMASKRDQQVAFALTMLAEVGGFNDDPSNVVKSSIPKMKLSLVLEIIAATRDCKNSVQNLAIKLLAQTGFQNDCEDEAVLNMMTYFTENKKGSSSNLESSEQNFYRIFFDKLDGETQARLVKKMSPSHRLIFADLSEPDFLQARSFEILFKCGKENSAQVFKAACSNFAKLAKDPKFMGESLGAENPDHSLLIELLKMLIAQGVNLKGDEIAQIFTVVAPNPAGFCRDKKIELQELIKDLVKTPTRFVEIFNSLSGHLDLAPLFAEADIEDVIKIFTAGTANQQSLSAEVLKSLLDQLMPKILAKGNIGALLTLNSSLIKEDIAVKRRDEYFIQMAKYMKVAQQEGEFWQLLMDLKFALVAELMFILTAYKSDSSISSTKLEAPIMICGFEVSNLEQVEALFLFFPLEIERHVGAIALDDNLIKSLNVTIKYRETKYLSQEHFQFLQALNKARSGAGVDMNQLVSYGDLLRAKSGFTKCKMASNPKSNLGKAIFALRDNPSFENFYASLLPDNLRILGLRREVGELSALKNWMRSQFKLIEAECKNIERQHPELEDFKMTRQPQQESPEAFSARKKGVEYQKCAELYKRRQKLAAAIYDYEVALKEKKSAFDKLRIIGEVMKIPAEFANLLSTSADIEHYNAMQTNDSSGSNYGGCWGKFLKNLENNIKLALLIADEKEFANSIAAQLALVRQSSCFINLQTQLRREIERRELADIHCAAITMAMFAGILPFIMQNAHNYDNPNGDELKLLYLAKNSFCHNVGNEVFKMLKEASDKEPKALKGVEKVLLEYSKAIDLINSILAGEVLVKEAGEVGEAGKAREVEVRKAKSEYFSVYQSKSGGGAAAASAGEIDLAEGFGDFLLQKQIEKINNLGYKACELAFPQEFFATFSRGLVPSSSVATSSGRLGGKLSMQNSNPLMRG